ncbi:glycoside hydrolase family 3 protein [Streptomyces sp. HUAS MG91]|uniref:beta-N-acetylhexosaminidase n=1 Tax=Streptomyces tabacisoli TaxID=3156398 RepID=A0AAU8IR97_9ACTN
MHHLSRRTLLAATTAGVAATALGAAPAQASKGPSDQALKKIISGMTLEEKVGQLFVMRVYGHSADAPDQADIDANLKEIGVRTADELIDKYKLGGIIYFQWAHNVRDPHQIADLSNGIQRAGQRQPSRIPLLIATDQEHGIVCRVGKPATLFPGAMALGAGGSHSDARKAGQIAGAELRALGIVQDYAPDADVNVNPANPVIGVRSFGADPDAVAGLVAAQVKGYQSANIASTAKHFPGHGDTATDSHTGLPVITHTREQWERLDRPSFEAAIAAGIDSIMTAHIVVPALDPAEDPATLSRPILTGILREQLGYDGVVITDSLGMEGVRTKYGDERVPVLALQAGVDQLLNPPTLDVSWNALLNAVKSGELTEARLDESILRVLRLKAKLGLFKGAKELYVSHSGVDRTVGTAAHLAAADRIAERTTTLLVNKEKLLPLSRRTHRNVLVLGANPASPSLSDGPPTTVIGAALTERGFSATVLATGTAPSQAVIDQAVAAAAGKDAVVIGTYNVTAGSAQQKLVNAVAATGVPVVTLSLRNPYDVAQLGAADAHVAAYSWIDVELRAAVRVLTGAAKPRGRLPVPVQRADDPAQVLYPIGYGLRY